jgi:hypothetical protein
MYLAEHTERDRVGAIEVWISEDQYDFRELGRRDRADDVAKEVWSVSVGFGQGGRCDLERSKGTEA